VLGEDVIRLTLPLAILLSLGCAPAYVSDDHLFISAAPTDEAFFTLVEDEDHCYQVHVDTIDEVGDLGVVHTYYTPTTDGEGMRICATLVIFEENPDA
jgi:hypothetical protein